MYHSTGLVIVIWLTFSSILNKVKSKFEKLKKINIKNPKFCKMADVICFTVRLLLISGRFLLRLYLSLDIMVICDSWIPFALILIINIVALVNDKDLNIFVYLHKLAEQNKVVSSNVIKVIDEGSVVVLIISLIGLLIYLFYIQVILEFLV